MSDLTELQNKINYTFRDATMLETALTHPSLVHESGGGAADNQRLEFLGDAVLQLILTEQLYREFPREQEGRLTKLRSHLANRHSLHHHALVLGLGEHLALGKGEESSGGRRRLSNLADAFEALIAAIYLDGGLEAARQFLLTQFAGEIELMKVAPQAENPKGQLQEILQARSAHGPAYRIISSVGPDHNKQFEAVVMWEEMELGRGSGSSKKEAEKRAAEAALAVIGEKLAEWESGKKLAASDEEKVVGS
jgi:ribonuclease-3